MMISEVFVNFPRFGAMLRDGIQTGGPNFLICSF